MEIYGGSNRYDPIAQEIDEWSREEPGTDPALVERCGLLYREALTLICRLGGSHSEPSLYNTQSVLLSSEPVPWVTNANNRGFVWLQASFELQGTEPPNTLDAGYSEVYLLAGVEPERTRARVLMVLGDVSISYAVDDDYRPGGHSEVDYLWGVVAKIRDAAFPKDPQVAAERARDLAADAQRHHVAEAHD